MLVICLNILQYVGSFKSEISCSDANADAKRRKICTDEIDQNIANSVDSSEITEAAGSSFSGLKDWDFEIQFDFAWALGSILIEIPLCGRRISK